MKKAIALFIVFLGSLSFSCDTREQISYQQKDVLVLAEKIPLPDISGRIDHIAFDSIHNLAFVAALGNNSVEIVNIDSQKVIRSIKGLHAPQGIVYISTLNRLVVANDEGGEVMFYDAANYNKLASINLKDDADNVRYDAEKGLVYVGYGSGGIAIIDAKTMKQITSVQLDGHPESFQLSKKQNRIFVNVPDANEIEVADLNSNSIIAKWKNTNASSNFPMALDEIDKQILVAYRNPPVLEIIDNETGKPIQTINCSGDADDLFYSMKDSLVFISTGKGFIDVFKDNGELKHINHIATNSGARTSLLLNSERKFLLAVPKRGGEAAALWVYKL